MRAAEAAIVIMCGLHRPPFRPLAQDVSLGAFPLRIERVELLAEALHRVGIGYFVLLISTITPPEKSGATISGNPTARACPCRFSARTSPGDGPVPMLNGDWKVPSPGRDYSYRSASTGSTLAARRVGAQYANSNTPANKTATPISVTGSLGST
jgi:hypothetical protein